MAPVDVTTLSPVLFPLYMTPEPHSSPAHSLPIYTGAIGDREGQGFMGKPSGNEHVDDTGDIQKNFGHFERTFQLGDAHLTIASNSNGLLVNGMPLGSSGTITLPNGRIVTMDQDRNLVVDGKTISAAQLHAQPTNPGLQQTVKPGSRVVPGLASETRSSTSYLEGDAAVTNTLQPNGNDQQDKSKKSDASSALDFWWSCVPIVLFGMISML
jgi:hypothetical protein